MASGKFKDLTGKRFGKLVVIERTDDYIQSDGKHKVMWLCRCDCGNIKAVLSHSLTSGRTKSCGCYNLKDLTGQKFGKLTVIKRVKSNKIGKTQWLCQCECGNEKIITGYSLTRGATKSCGCMKTKQIKKLHRKRKEFLIQLGGLCVSFRNPFYKKSCNPNIKVNSEGIIEI